MRKFKYELGCNAVRTSHYPQSHDFIDRCDELGLLVFTEIPGWQHIGGIQWKAQAVKNTEEMVQEPENTKTSEEVIQDSEAPQAAVSEPEKKIEQEELERLEEEEERPGGILTGRTELWEAGLKTFVESPVFGVTRENITERVGANLADKYWENDLARGGLHNIYLTVLVSSGIVGFVLFMAFILIYVVKAIRYVFSAEARKQNGFVMCLITISAVLLIMEFLEARILYQVGIFYIIFWCIAGYVLCFTDKTRREVSDGH